MPKTRSPGAKRVTSGSTSSTTPATSQPKMSGGSPTASLYPPSLTGFPVDRVDPGGGDTNKHLGRNGLGPLHISQLEDLWPAQGRHHNGLQRLTSTR